MILPKNIKIINSTKISKTQLIELEKLTTSVFNEEYSTFLSKYSGGIPKINGKDCVIHFTYENGFKDSNWIQKIESFETFKTHWGNMKYLYDFQAHFNVGKEYVEVEYLLPFMHLMSHNLLYANGGIHSGKIYHVDNGDFGFCKIANTIKELLDMFEMEK